MCRGCAPVKYADTGSTDGGDEAEGVEDAEDLEAVSDLSFNGNAGEKRAGL